ncbi:DnaA-like protein [Anaeroplasma bactoclasticum]|jgi:hypothetical protein|uniref:DnaA-like protein n=1 Tax=Anaeroplasma bactoclasticum TaxID=2088 RepID=A0A397RW23_9MOLU|nr:DnaA N-terminal domain-containing protein [Anaeroplasma bactoclasticum]RIA77928.1 DnaA-like protein [Anaeroplasma bactoclasticum]
MNNIFDARQYVLNELGDKVNDPRVREELSLMTDKNFMEVYYSKKISDFLKSNNEYYIVRGFYGNLYINFFLDITDSIEPYDLPYEFVFDKKEQSFIYDFNVSTSFESKLIDYLNEISNGVMVRTTTSCLIPYTNQTISLDDYENRNHEKLIEIGIMGMEGLSILNKNIKKYGLPNYDITQNNEISYEIFNKRNIEGITGINTNMLSRLLERCDESTKSFDTYVYLTAGMHGTNVISQIYNSPITEDTIKKYPTTREGLYALLIESKIDKQTALQICEYTRKGRKYRANNKAKWEELTSNITVSLRRYLDNIDGLFPLAHCISFAKLNYLEIFYKLMNEPSNESKTVNDYFKEELGHNIKKRDEYLTEYQEIWDNVRKLIKKEINRYAYDECFEDTAVIAYENGIVSVKVPNTIVKFKLNQCYYKLIKQSQKEVTGKPIMFKFV